MKRTKTVTKGKLFINELERPLPAVNKCDVTTLMLGEECSCGGKVTTMAIGEEAK